VDSWVNGERSNTVYSETSDYYWSFNQVHTFRYALYGDNQKFWRDKDTSQTPDISISDTTHTSAGRLGLAAAQVRGWWDNFRVRQYLEPEPVASLGAEEEPPPAEEPPPVEEPPKPRRVGGDVYPVDKAALLMPWLGLVLLLALAGAYLARLTFSKLKG
jgi:hypothetical protein